MTTVGTAIPRLQDLRYFEVAMSQLAQGASFERIRRALVDFARDLDRESDHDGSFDELKWERRRNDKKEYVNNAVDVLKEVMRLGWVERRVLPSSPASAYLHAQDAYDLLPPGQAWAELAANDRPEAFNSLAGILMDAHPQFGGFLRAVGAMPDSTASAFTIPLLRWDPRRHLSEDLYLDDLVTYVAAAVSARHLGWSSEKDNIDDSIRGYVGRIRARRAARDKTQTRREFLKTCEESVTKVAFGAAEMKLDYISMELLRRWSRFLGVANFSYYAPGPYALRLWATATVTGTGRNVSINRRTGPEIRRQALQTLFEIWQERRSNPGATMYPPIWELRAAVCWRLRIADSEWDKAIREVIHGDHDDLPFRVHLDQASFGPTPASTAPLVLPSPTGNHRVFNVMTIIPRKETS